MRSPHGLPGGPAASSPSISPSLVPLLSPAVDSSDHPDTSQTHQHLLSLACPPHLKEAILHPHLSFCLSQAPKARTATPKHFGGAISQVPPAPYPIQCLRVSHPLPTAAPTSPLFVSRPGPNPKRATYSSQPTHVSFLSPCFSASSKMYCFSSQRVREGHF